MYDAFERYAVYWVPTADQRISRFGLDWTGWCADRGEHQPRRPVTGLTGPGAPSAGALARHGLHGVFAAPFRLRHGRNVWALEQAVEQVAATCAPIRLAALRAALVGGRVSLVPQAPTEALDDLTDRVDAALVDLVAPAERSMRPANGHGFNIPLCEAHVPAVTETALQRIQVMIDRLRLAPVRIADLALMGDPGHERPLRVLRRFGLGALDAEPLRRGGLETRGPQLLAGLIERTCPSPTLSFG